MIRKNFPVVNSHFCNMFGAFSQYLYGAVVQANLNGTAELICIVFFKRTQRFYFQLLYWNSSRVAHFGSPELKLVSFCGCQFVTFLLWDLLGHRCYLCDDEVQYCNSNRLGQVVDYVRKQAGNTTPKSGKIICFLIQTVTLIYIICGYLVSHTVSLHIAE